ncbi:transcriptional regulator [Shewanella algicola]|uniref:Helix-turn-helix transcriptional regulator n=1 Tax=Shewanella algicola TaxID=640633 RepID=A0A9X1ZAX3_9GAMM|nr:helix-turn-helix transcriptional regulator [Shewanella algicola]MCL1103708.1 helix-turn-helix transcriptional regulator [Shewanella algicola]GGP37553.1 transcriptional regulator [Shewanella algicola]
MKTLAQNLQEKLKASGLTQKELAERANISQVMVHKLISGKAKESSKLVAIANVLGTTAEELITGKVRAKAEANAEWAGPMETWDSNTPLSDDEVEIPFYMEVELAAGHGIVEMPHYYGPKLRFAKSTLRKSNVDPTNAACVRVSGNSMEPVLPNGSTVGVDTSQTNVIDGKMYAINHDGMLRIKTLYKLPGGGLRLRSFNLDEWPDERYEGDDLKQITVIGKVFWYSVLL